MGLNSYYKYNIAKFFADDYKTFETHEEQGKKNDEYRAVKQKSDNLSKGRKEIEAYLKK